MPNVTFQEEESTSRVPDALRRSLLTRLVLMSGFAKTPQGAEHVLIGVAVSAVLLAGAIVIFLSPSDAAPVPQSVMDAALPR